MYVWMEGVSILIKEAAMNPDMHLTSVHQNTVTDNTKMVIGSCIYQYPS